MKVLVTGGSGFLGSHIAEQLTQAGHTVRALVRKSSNRKFLSTLKNVELAEGAVDDRDSVFEAMKGGVDAVIHSAGVVKAKTEADFFACNTRGTVNLLEAAVEHAPSLKRFVHVSSLEARGPSRGESISFDDASPVTAYGRSKLAAEKECLARKDKLPVVILRPGAIYGPRDVELLEAFKAAKKRQWPVIDKGDMLGSYVYGPDCARACIVAIDANVPSGSIYSIDDGEPMPMVRAMGELLHEALGTRPLVKMGVPFPILRLASLGVEAYGKVRGKPVMLTREKVAMLSKDWAADDSQRARDDLGWKPQTPFTEGLKKTADWYRENGWL